MLYTEAIFTSPILKYDQRLQAFIRGESSPWSLGLSRRLLPYVDQVHMSHGYILHDAKKTSPWERTESPYGASGHHYVSNF